MRCECSERSYTSRGELPNPDWMTWTPLKPAVIMMVLSRPIILTVAKCWDPSPQGYFTLPRSECTASVSPPWLNVGL